MGIGTLRFILKLLGLSLLLLAIHYYLFFIFFAEIELYFPIWTIYAFNAGLVFIVYSVIQIKVSAGSRKVFTWFLGLTLSKMILAILFLLPLFLGKSTQPVTEVVNFFIPYFCYLIFEVLALFKFLKNQ